ncbi:TIGR03857 family LLM class F420-dependent oxidoreductase [Nocardia sp. NPDC057353]|uniref:TIGR03857 family LLM class F420-dependent oxidoreductase n=1 Tax=Nocardia sp. NPDC057353 TaxID=3346104 RepID=UPI00363C2ABC
MTRTLDELGYYLLPGAGGAGPAGVLDEASRGEELGLGTAFVSERWNIKEAATLSTAACAATTRLRVATAATNHNTRHPLITASWATTLHRLSGGRFTLGIGRGVPGLYDLFGIPSVTTAQMEEFARVMRTLWSGGVISDYDGPLGQYRTLYLDGDFREEIPLGLVAFGPKSLALGGRAFDDVVLHTYFSPATLNRCAGIVKDAAERAGRDPGKVRVWSCLATIGDHLPEEVRRNRLVGRLATYLQGYGDLMVRTNDWDPAVLRRFREDPVVQSIPGAIDRVATDEQLRHIEELLPASWTESAATGTPEECAARIRAEFEHGADRVILHGATADELAPIVAAYRAAQPVAPAGVLTGP